MMMKRMILPNSMWKGFKLDYIRWVTDYLPFPHHVQVDIRDVMYPYYRIVEMKGKPWRQ